MFWSDKDCAHRTLRTVSLLLQSLTNDHMDLESKEKQWSSLCVVWWTLCHFAPPRIKVSGMSKKRGAIMEDDQWPMVNDRHTRIMVNGNTGMVIISIMLHVSYLYWSQCMIMMMMMMMLVIIMGGTLRDRWGSILWPVQSIVSKVVALEWWQGCCCKWYQSQHQ